MSKDNGYFHPDASCNGIKPELQDMLDYLMEDIVDSLNDEYVFTQDEVDEDSDNSSLTCVLGCGTKVDEYLTACDGEDCRAMMQEIYPETTIINDIGAI